MSSVTVTGRLGRPGGQQLNHTWAGDPKAVALAPVLAAGTGRELISGLMDLIERFCYAARHHPIFRARVADWVSFKEPQKTDFQHLVHCESENREGHDVLVGPVSKRRRRDGFALTDRRMNERQVLYEVDHCIYCHDRDTDSCSKGMCNRKEARTLRIWDGKCCQQPITQEVFSP